MELKIKKVNENAIIPKRATQGSAGMDLCACIDAPLTLRGGETAVIPTGIAIALPSNEAGAFGVIDSDYRGEIKVGVINQINEPYTIEPGERIAQLVVMPVCPVDTVEVESLDETARGEGGFGSTGTK